MAYFSQSPIVHSFLPQTLIRDTFNETASIHEIALASKAPVLGQQLADLLRNALIHRTVAERKGVIAGFSVYTFEPGELAVKLLAVRPSHQFKGVARALLDDLKTRLDARYRMMTCVLEDDRYGGIRFLSHCGMRATRPILWDRFGRDRDGYRFVFPADIAAANYPEVVH